MFKRIANLFRGFFSLFVSDMEKSNPKALIEVEKENLRKNIANFNDNLATQAGFIERLMRQIKDLEKKEKELTARIGANLKIGNRKAAGQMALELQTVKSQLEENRQQMITANDTYKKLEKSRDAAVAETKEKIAKLKRMITETEMMEAQADLQEMASGMVTQMDTPGDSLNRVEEYIQERRDKAAGRARVAAGNLDTTDIELKEAEQEALAEMALSEFETAYGFKSPEADASRELDDMLKSPAHPTTSPTATPTPTPGPKKEMGPKE